MELLEQMNRIAPGSGTVAVWVGLVLVSLFILAMTYWLFDNGTENAPQEEERPRVRRYDRRAKEQAEKASKES